MQQYDQPFKVLDKTSISNRDSHHSNICLIEEILHVPLESMLNPHEASELGQQKQPRDNERITGACYVDIVTPLSRIQ